MSPGPTTTQTEPRRGLSRRTTIALAVAGVVGIAGGSVVGLKLRPHDDPSPTSSAPSGTTCWNGTTAPAPSGCPAMHGARAVGYLFPQFEADDLGGQCYQEKAAEVALETGKVAAWDCGQTLPSGQKAVLVYGEWSSWAAARQHYRSKYADPGRLNRGFLAWGPARQATTYQMAVLIRQTYPFSVTIKAATGPIAEEAFSGVRPRSFETINRPG